MTEPMPQVTVVPPPPPPADAPSRRRRGLAAAAVAVAVILVAGAVAFAVTQRGGSAEAKPLALRFTEGQSQSYEIHMTMDGRVSSDLTGELPLEMEMSQVVSWSVVSVEDEGVATVEVTTSEMSGSMNGIPLPQEQADVPAIEMEIAPDGRVLSIGGMPLGPFGDLQGFGGLPGSAQLTPILPGDGVAVAPGDSWEREFSQDLPLGDGSIEVVAESRYDRNEEVDGRDAAVIVTDLSMPIDFSFDFDDLAGLAAEFGATGPTGVGELGDASMSMTGGVSYTQTSFIDLGAQELLSSESSGDMEMRMDMAGVPGIEGPVTISAAFTQGLERR
jgi:hypothetical protein